MAPARRAVAVRVKGAALAVVGQLRGPAKAGRPVGQLYLSVAGALPGLGAPVQVAPLQRARFAHYLAAVR